MASNKKSNKWYTKNLGNDCPFCEGTELESQESPQSDAGLVWQRIKCLNCNKEWDDLYKLVGFEEK